METKYFSLSSDEKNTLVKIIQIVFGIICIAVALFWMIFNIRLLKAEGTLWITIIFLTGFGFFQIWSGLGRAIRFIEIRPDKIVLKKNIVLPSIEFSADEIDKIEVYPMNLIFFLKPEKKVLLRFGSTYFTTNELIKDEIISFAESNKISLEIMEEKL